MIYCYRCPECGKLFERRLAMSEHDVPQKCECGAVARRDYVAEHGGQRSGQKGWPMESEAAGVHPSQIGEARKLIRDKGGVDCQFTSEGNPIFTSMEHRRKCLHAMGYEDKLAYY